MFPTVHGLVSQGWLSAPPPDPGGDASDLPPATRFRLTAFQNWGSNIADVSELWLGSDSSTRFASAVAATLKSAGGASPGIVDGSLTDTGNSQSFSGGCWWEVEYTSPETLAYVQVARPNSTASRRLRTWAVRAFEPTLGQWLTALLRGDTDDMNSAATYASFDLGGSKVLVTPLIGTAGGAVGSGYTQAEQAVSGGAGISVARPSYVDENDAILLIWGNSGAGATEYPVTPPAGVTPVYDAGGLYVGLRITDEQGAEPASYTGVNADSSQRSMAVTARTLHNVDPTNPVGEVKAALSTKTPPSVAAAGNQAVLVVALYAVNETGIEPPDGFTLIGDMGRAAGAGTLRIVSALRVAQDDGVVQPGDWGSSGTPLRVVTALLNASTP